MVAMFKDCVYRVTRAEFQLHIIFLTLDIDLRYRPYYSKCKDLYYKPQNHSTMTT